MNPIAPFRTGEYILTLTSKIVELATNRHVWPETVKVTFRECRMPILAMNPDKVGIIDQPWTLPPPDIGTFNILTCCND